MVINLSKKITHFTFLVFSSMVFIWAYIIPFFLEEYGKEAWIYVLIGGFLSLFVIILPKRQIPTNILIKIVEALYLFLSSLFLLYLVINALSNFLLLDYGFTGPLLVLIISVILMEGGKRDTLFYAGTLLFVFGIIFLFVPFFLDVKSVNLDLCLPIKMKGNILKIVIIFFLPLDLTYLYHLGITKKEIIVSSSFVIVLSSLYLLNLISVFGETYLSKVGFPGFLLYENKGASSLFGQLDFIYLYLIPISIIYNVGLRLCIMKENINLKNSIFVRFITGIVLFFSVYLFNKISFDLFYVLGALLLIIFLWRIYELFKRNKEKV